MGFKYSMSYNLRNNKGGFMKHEEFKKILKENNLTIKKFSELANISYATCNTWSNRGAVSSWVISWLNLYIEIQELKQDEPKQDDCEEYKKALAKALQDNLK